MTVVPHRILVIGGGISGLSLSYFLKKNLGNYVNITIAEKENRLGGCIKTVSVIKNDQYFFEQGPNCLKLSPHTYEILSDFNLLESIVPINSFANKRKIWAVNSIEEMPYAPIFENFVSMNHFQSINPFLLHLISSCFSKVFNPLTCWKENFVSPLSSEYSDETVYDFSHRRFGKRFATLVADSLVAAICGGDSKKLSMRSLYPHAWYAEKDFGSITKALLYYLSSSLHPITSFTKKSKIPIHSDINFIEGMSTLVMHFERFLQSQEFLNINLNSSVTSLSYVEKNVKVEWNNQPPSYFDHVFCTIPPYYSQKIFNNFDHPELSQLLSFIPSTLVKVVNTGFNRRVLRNWNKYGGMLIPSITREQSLAIIFDSELWPKSQKSKQTKISILLGQERYPQIRRHNDTLIEEIALLTLNRCVNLEVFMPIPEKAQEVPDVVLLSPGLYPLSLYPIGHHKIVENIQEVIQNKYSWLTISGTGLYGLKMHQCIETSANIVSRFIKRYIRPQIESRENK